MKTPWFREFDLDYWRMREALGFPIPDRIDRRFRKKLAGNGGHNPFKCGVCDARRKFPGLHISEDIRSLRRRLTGPDREDFEHRLALALREDFRTVEPSQS